MNHIHCNVFGHDFKISKDITAHVKEYRCRNCKKQMTTNGNGNLIPLTPKFKEINSVLSTIYNKKKKRNKEIILNH